MKTGIVRKMHITKSVGEALLALGSLLVLLVMMAPSAQAEERFARIFQDNMVLQRDKPVSVWGWAKPGTPVEVTFAGQNKQGQSNDKGYWKVVFDPLKADRKGQVLAANIGGTQINCQNVLIGEVWLAAGQSNMGSDGPDVDTGVYPFYVSPGTTGGKPEIRIAKIGSSIPREPMDDMSPKDWGGKKIGAWVTLVEAPPKARINPYENFARVIRDALDVPVGIVPVAVPGTAQTSWMARETLESFPALGPKGSNYYQELLAAFTNDLAKASTSWEAFQQTQTTWLESKEVSNQPGGANSLLPAYLYNGRIHPLAPLAMRGVIWHQGEAGPAGPWDARLVAMVKQWRKLFGQDFTFIWGTLTRGAEAPPPLNPIRSGFYRSSAAARTALPLFGADKNVAYVELYDVGDDGTHYLQKAEMGRRLGLAAMTVTYGKNQIYTGPRMVETKIEGAKARVRFEHVGDGLVYQPSINGISGFFVSGKGDKTSKWADVKLVSKDTIEVSHPEIKELGSVAYGANMNPHETLFNSAGLPASPFDLHPDVGAFWAYDKPCLAPPLLLRVVKPAGAGVNVAHVRRGGYVFQQVGKGGNNAHTKAEGPSTVEAFIPAEWKGFEVTVGGKPLAASESTTTNGNQFVTFDIPTDGTWVIVAEKGKAKEFEKVNRF